MPHPNPAASVLSMNEQSQAAEPSFCLLCPKKPQVLSYLRLNPRIPSEAFFGEGWVILAAGERAESYGILSGMNAYSNFLLTRQSHAHTVKQYAAIRLVRP